MLRNEPRVRITQLASVLDPSRSADLVLFDTFASSAESHQVVRILREPRLGRLVVYTWDATPENVVKAMDLGASGYLSKAMNRAELVDALLRIHRGERVVAPTRSRGRAPQPEEPSDWPGKNEGLTQREAEIVGLVTQGLTNEDIAARLYISPNSLKTHIRHAYRKMGCLRRSEAILWGVARGMSPTAALVDMSEDQLGRTA